MAELIPIFKKELQDEAAITRKMFSRIPDDKFDWKPHEKNMSVQKLAAHIAELPGWIAMTFTSDGLDFAKGDYKPTQVNNKKELMKFFEETLEIGESHLRPEYEKDLGKAWVLRNGDVVLQKYTKAEVIRMVLNQITHHRAQLGMYLRLMDVPVPGSYGPSADEH